MMNLLRMDFYRLIKGRMLWVFLGIIVVVVALMTVFFAFLHSDAGKDFLMNSVQDGSGTIVRAGGAVSLDAPADVDAMLTSMFDLTQIEYVTQAFAYGGGMYILLFLLVVLFCAAEFESGFAKNVFSVRQSKTAFFASKFILMIVVSVVFLLFGTALSMLSAAILGIDLRASTPTEWLTWLGLSALVTLAYELILAAVVWLVRNKVAGIVLAVMLAVGVIGGLLSWILGFFFGSDALKALLYTGMKATGAGSAGIEELGVTTIVVVSVIYAVVAIAAGLVALKKRDV